MVEAAGLINVQCGLSFFFYVYFLVDDWPNCWSEITFNVMQNLIFEL